MSFNTDELFKCFGFPEDSQTDSTNSVKRVLEHTENGTHIPNKRLKSESKKTSNNTLKEGGVEKEEDSDSNPNNDDDEILNIDEFLTKTTTVDKLASPESCIHEVVYPSDVPYIPLASRRTDPAKTYTFKLDPFQEESISCIDNNRSVLVAAHTSAGKTVVAEYAIAQSLKNKQRVIYTTPIKALSNQKYRDFQREFEDVGLITGDVTINQDASCLVMTTEILRNMLYRGSEIVREVGWVIFDEVHYMRNKERGVVWEESIILMQSNVRFVFLSATIPNSTEFAEWIVHLHKSPCHVIYTEFRPTPLLHYVFAPGTEEIHKVYNSNETFEEDNFNQVMKTVKKSAEDVKKKEKNRKDSEEQNSTETDIYKLVKMVINREMAPAIVFCFSKRYCEVLANQLAGLDFTTLDEKKSIDLVFKNAIKNLSENNQKLKQIESTLPLLQRGIGVHHSGLIPIMKEVTEILFGEGLVKVLFATETFAMGLNMPARTVIFSTFRKFDGEDYRWITSGEYIQMSGRAGRRGLDKNGIVIMLVHEKMSASAVKKIIRGSPDPLNSAFYLNYNMILNLMRIQHIQPEYLLKRSFSHFQNQNKVPQMFNKYLKAMENYKNIKLESETEIASFCALNDELDSIKGQFRTDYCLNENYKKYDILRTGRCVYLQSPNTGRYYPCTLIVKIWNREELGKIDKFEKYLKHYSSKLFIDVLLPVKKYEYLESCQIPEPYDPTSINRLEIVKVPVEMISHFTTIWLAFRSGIYKNASVKQSTFKKIQTTIKLKREALKQHILMWPTDVEINEDNFTSLLNNWNLITTKLGRHSLNQNPKKQELCSLYAKKSALKIEYIALKNKVLQTKSVLHMHDLKIRKNILRRLGYCTQNDVIKEKGHVACDLSSGDSILLTELMFNGFFNSLSPNECTTILSAIVCDETSKKEATHCKELLSGPLQLIQNFMKTLVKVSNEEGLYIDEDEYLNTLKTCLMDVIFYWCNNVTFSRVCEVTDILEGSVIRIMKRLNELLEEIVQASQTMGNSDLVKTFKESIKHFKKDIVFIDSLYQ